MSAVASLLKAAQARSATAPAPAAPAPRSAPKLDWEDIPADSLPDDLREAFYAIGKARSHFEALMTAKLEPPAHLKLVFAYKRGLAVALAERKAPSDGFAALMSRLSAAE